MRQAPPSEAIPPHLHDAIVIETVFSHQELQQTLPHGYQITGVRALIHMVPAMMHPSVAISWGGGPHCFVRGGPLELLVLLGVGDLRSFEQNPSCLEGPGVGDLIPANPIRTSV